MRRFPANKEERQWLEQFAGRWELVLAALGKGEIPERPEQGEP
jgi:hypothetical protein